MLSACPRIIIVLVIPLAAGCKTFPSTPGKSHPPHAATRVAEPRLKVGEVAAPQKPSAWQNHRFQSLLARAERLEREGKPQEAIGAYKQALGIVEDREILHRLALLCQSHGNDADAQACFERCLTLDPNNPDLLADAGYRAYLIGDLELARTHYQAAVAVAPESPRVLSNYAILMHARGDNDRALELFERAGCSETEALANVGELCLMNRDEDLAEYYFQLARSLEESSSIQQAGSVNLRQTATFARHRTSP